MQSSSSVTVTATNRGGNRSVSISYEVQAVATLPVVEDPGAQLFTYGVQDGFTLRATGAPTPSWGLQSGSTLPPGIGIVDNGDGTATVSGTPTDVFSTADVVFVASNSAGDVPLTVSFTVQGVLPRLVAIGAQTLTVNQVYPGITLTTIAGYPRSDMVGHGSAKRINIERRNRRNHWYSGHCGSNRSCDYRNEQCRHQSCHDRDVYGVGHCPTGYSPNRRYTCPSLYIRGLLSLRSISEQPEHRLRVGDYNRDQRFRPA